MMSKLKDSAKIACTSAVNSDISGFVKQTKVVPKRDKNGDIHFSDRPDFVPNLTPMEIFHLGSFGGTYYRPIYSCITRKSYDRAWLEFPLEWFPADIDSYVASEKCDISRNRYGKKSGTSLRYWENKGWINPIDPYGWVQWYCRFYLGRRSHDDDRQISRFLKTADKQSGRWRINLTNQIIEKANALGVNPKTLINDYTISPTIRQLLQHWGYVLKEL